MTIILISDKTFFRLEMPLPPALAARLAKRGILRDASVAGYDPQLGKALEPQPQKGRGGGGGGGG